MSLPQEPRDARLFVGLLFRDFGVREEALREFCGLVGPLDFLSEPVLFTQTNYYDREMGRGLYRQVATFTSLVCPESLPDIKLATNEIEGRFTRDGKRQVNIDPGLLNEERLVLATGKNFTHRVYLRNGIYADLTLIYQRDAYRALPWTYPDYREPDLLHWLGALRRKLVLQRGQGLPDGGEA